MILRRHESLVNPSSTRLSHAAYLSTKFPYGCHCSVRVPLFTGPPSHLCSSLLRCGMVSAAGAGEHWLPMVACRLYGLGLTVCRGPERGERAAALRDLNAWRELQRRERKRYRAE
jgi:hypothetical protein